MPSFGGSPEVPCMQCGRRVPGLGWGDRCADCIAERRRRASRLSRWIALAVSAVAAVSVFSRLPSDPTARYYGGLAIIVTYIVVRRIVQRIAMEVLP